MCSGSGLGSWRRLERGVSLGLHFPVTYSLALGARERERGRASRCSGLARSRLACAVRSRLVRVRAPRRVTSLGPLASLSVWRAAWCSVHSLRAGHAPVSTLQPPLLRLCHALAHLAPALRHPAAHAPHTRTTARPRHPGSDGRAACTGGQAGEPKRERAACGRGHERGEHAGEALVGRAPRSGEVDGVELARDSERRLALEPPGGGRRLRGGRWGRAGGRRPGLA